MSPTTPRIRPSRRRLIAVLPSTATIALLTLAGCASLPGQRPAEDEPPREWRGRFALDLLATASSAADQASGRFSLIAGRRFTELELISPLGNTLASARSSAEGAVLRSADGRSWEAADAGALTEQVFGWRIPIDRLPDWLEGRMAVVTERESAPPARPVTGREGGWQVRIDQWDDVAPRRLTLIFPHRVRLRLIVDGR